ncbi:MAG: DNA-directed RNA polymerase subunit omega [Candidatus Omnitrophota bacterium]
MLEKSGGSIFRLTRMAMVRALELASGSPALVQHTPTRNLTSIALEEIAQGKVQFDENSRIIKKVKEKNTEKE